MAIGNLTYENLVAKLIEAVPEINERHELLVQDREFFGPGSTFDNALVPYILALLEYGGSDEVLNRIFAFLEEMARCEEQRVRDVLGVCVCEYISGHSFLHRAWRYMGEATRVMARRIAAGWGHPLPEDHDLYEGMDAERYAQRFKEELDKVGGLQNVTGVDILNIRERLFGEFGVPTDRI